MSTPEFFVLNPKNRLFLDGKEKVPHTVRPPVWRLLILPCAIVAVIVGVILWFQREERLQRYLQAHGVRTTAVVLHTETHFTDNGEVDRATFRYVARDGNQRRTITRTQNVREAIRFGPTVDVLYDPANPDVVRIEDELDFIRPSQRENNRMAYVLLSVMAGFIFLLAFGRWLGEGLMPALCLRRNPGKPLQGELIECKKNVYSEDFTVSARFRFVSPAGKTIEAESPLTRRDDLEKQPLPAPGTPVHVYYVDDKQYWCL